MDKKQVKFIDTTLRDGSQSLWAMKMTYGIYDAVVEELDQAGYDYIDLPMHAPYMIMAFRFFSKCLILSFMYFPLQRLSKQRPGLRLFAKLKHFNTFGYLKSEHGIIKLGFKLYVCQFYNRFVPI